MTDTASEEAIYYKGSGMNNIELELTARQIEPLDVPNRQGSSILIAETLDFGNIVYQWVLDGEAPTVTIKAGNQEFAIDLRDAAQQICMDRLGQGFNFSADNSND